MSNVTELASGLINGRDQISIEMIEAANTPAVVIVTWPAKPTVLHPHRFPSSADTAARTFAAAVVKLAQIGRGGNCDQGPVLERAAREVLNNDRTTVEFQRLLAPVMAARWMVLHRRGLHHQSGG